MYRILLAACFTSVAMFLIFSSWETSFPMKKVSYVSACNYVLECDVSWKFSVFHFFSFQTTEPLLDEFWWNYWAWEEMILNCISPYVLLKDNDTRSFLRVPNIKTRSVEGRAFRVEIGYALIRQVFCFGCALKLVCRESGHSRPLSPREVSVPTFPEAVT